MSCTSSSVCSSTTSSVNVAPAEDKSKTSNQEKRQSEVESGVAIYLEPLMEHLARGKALAEKYILHPANVALQTAHPFALAAVPAGLVSIATKLLGFSPPVIAVSFVVVVIVTLLLAHFVFPSATMGSTLSTDQEMPPHVTTASNHNNTTKTANKPGTPHIKPSPTSTANTAVAKQNTNGAVKRHATSDGSGDKTRSRLMSQPTTPTTPTTPTINVTKNKLKSANSQVYKVLGDALTMDENNGDPTETLKIYKRGLAMLERALVIPIEASNPERANLFKLKDKMQLNKVQVKDRIEVLEAIVQSKKSTKGPTTPATSKARGRSVPPQNGKGSAGRSMGRNKSSARSVSPRTATTGKSDATKTTFPGVDSKLAITILDEVLDKNTGISMEDVIGLENAKAALLETVILPAKRPELFKGLRAPAKGLLLFGPPGNGKTMLAKAVAQSSGCTFFNISAATLVSKWVGESEKMVRALFAMARELQPSIIFIDEIDCILKARDANEHEGSRRLKTEMMVQIDGAASKQEDHVLVMGATNRPQELDSAVVRRLSTRIYVPLPDHKMRAKIISSLMAKVKNNLSEYDINKIASATEGFSGSDLTCLARDAALNPVRRLGLKLETASESDVAPVGVNDFKEGMTRVRHSVGKKEVEEMERWNLEFGYKA